MPNNLSPLFRHRLDWFGLCACLIIAGCASPPPSVQSRAPETETPPTARAAPEPAKITDAERLQAERLRHCQEDKRRLELSLKESQKRTDELQGKLDALLAIDRDIRSRGKIR